ncbi:MAG: transcriptional regulator [Stygiobacter sp. RIFOXYC12_FULL_38_8]|nr:MAG: transcriptional regulator [Stygiobacter sp. GWC2_38_9]OGU81380.1 MAG: transcriptional regulator [Stygiobacter sp. RIFOXYA12_FULL_38_9]OGV09608.1 MAG: transcriptional regulator [Stygiobacter sp. RIFOXYB2_FULL_37_11]OGV16738.1 MAG: transcriptional regulator [Stygiobacter sp. RIFOXYC2_FULL_38_25]OGV18168.1 MAG: transcriptional regulator [Stygiobacter sp. RIFOXYA2_FULL_38_8]OGV25183.1 MAG: transcriptional regulator [Stygiobacter sp. RIFOXYC12_FULL_38_8]OGV82911.1 MAG: transcriptional regu
MGRIFETRKHVMFARYARMSKAFNRVRKDIEIAVKAGGPDVKSNSKLRIAMQNAKSVNMPKDKVEQAIKRAYSKDTTGYQEIMYEGYAPHGVAVIVECATDNPTRTVANVRHIFRKNEGALGNAGSIAFMFEKRGLIKVAKSVAPDLDEFELELIDFGLEDLSYDDDNIYITTSFQDFGSMQKALEEKNIEIGATETQYIPTTTKELNDELKAEVKTLLDALEEDDDVQAVHNNMQ